MSNYFEAIMKDLNIKYLESAGDVVDTLQRYRRASKLLSEIEEACKREYKSTGKVKAETFAALKNFDPKKEYTRPLNVSSESKENCAPEKTPTPPRNTRPRRQAFNEATQQISGQSNISLSAKLRRPTDLNNEMQNVYVKVEKLSIAAVEQSQDLSQVVVKSEKEEMPAPKKRAPRKKAKKTDVKVKQEKLEEVLPRESDVILKESAVEIFEISDDEDKKSVERIKPEPRTTRARTKQKKPVKRSRSSSPDQTISSTNSNNGSKRSKSNDMFEDAVDTLIAENSTQINDGADKTFVANKPTELLNATVVIENPKIVLNDATARPQKTVEEIMTDDESPEKEQLIKIPQVGKSGKQIPKLAKQIFSPFEQSPVKKKVQAFEEYCQEAETSRQTRTKTRAQAKHAEEEVASKVAPTTSNVKEKTKWFTPMTSRFLPASASTSVKASTKATPNGNLSSVTSNESLISAKNASALKASQAAYRERERKKREKEEEALKKREAMLHAQTEERRRKREEKVQKVHKQKEVIEKQKLQNLEAQRLKDERHKQLVAEQEEKRQRLKEETELKRKLAKMRAIEEKKKEEARQREEERKIEEMNKQLASKDEEIAKMLKAKNTSNTKPMYMRTRPPRLPTADCYDSDEEEYDENKLSFPKWCSGVNLEKNLRAQHEAGEAIKNTLFARQAQTPDLRQIFEVIDPVKLQRTSSAIWHKPPRFSMIPDLQMHVETEEFDEFD